MRMFSYGVMIAALAGCMPPQENQGEVKSFDAGACVDWSALKKDYHADLSSLPVYLVDNGVVSPHDGSRFQYLSLDKSKTAYLHTLTMSSKDFRRKSATKDWKIKDIFIKQAGSSKDAWDLEELTDVGPGYSTEGSDPNPIPNYHLARKIQKQRYLDYVKRQIEIGGIDDSIEGNTKEKIIADYVREFEHAIISVEGEIKHYAGTSEDEDGKTEVHVLAVGMGAQEKDRDEDAQKKEDAKKKNEEQYDDYQEFRGARLVLVTLFHNGNVYSSEINDDTRTQNQTEIAEAAEVLITPGIQNYLAGKYFLNASCVHGPPPIKSNSKVKFPRRRKTVDADDENASQ